VKRRGGERGGREANEGDRVPPIGRIPHPRPECRARTAVAPSGRACEVEDDAREVEDDARSGGPFVLGLAGWGIRRQAAWAIWPLAYIGPSQQREEALRAHRHRPSP